MTLALDLASHAVRRRRRAQATRHYRIEKTMRFLGNIDVKEFASHAPCRGTPGIRNGGGEGTSPPKCSPTHQSFPVMIGQWKRAVLS